MASPSISRTSRWDRVAAGIDSTTFAWPLWLIGGFLVWLAYSFVVLGIQFRDEYVAYSGTVVAKGRNSLILAEGDENYYLVIREADGRDHRRYVSTTDFLMAEVGTVIVKQRGLSQHARRPGQLTPYELLDSLERMHSDRFTSRRPD